MRRLSLGDIVKAAVEDTITELDTEEVEGEVEEFEIDYLEYGEEWENDQSST
jgi:hypothetical protein